MYPLIRPADRLKPIFRVIENRRTDLEHKHDSRSTALSSASQIRALDKLHDKVMALTSLVQSARLHLAISSYPMPDVSQEEKVPGRVRRAFADLGSFLSSLDRNNYYNVYQMTSHFLRRQEQMLFELSDKIINETFRLRQSQQQTKQQKIQQLIQSINQLRPPPQLTRSHALSGSRFFS